MPNSFSPDVAAKSGVSKLQNIMLQPLGYDVDRKNSFHCEARRLLRQLAKALFLLHDSYDIRSNKGGIAVSGEVILHSEQIYVQVSQSGISPDHEILFRRCNGRKDYYGEQNHFAAAHELSEPRSLAKTIYETLQLID